MYTIEDFLKPTCEVAIKQLPEHITRDLCESLMRSAALIGYKIPKLPVVFYFV